MNIICLANSYKNQNRCIAGIEQQSGKWVRPISNLNDGRIPIDNESIKIETIKLLDIVQFATESRQIMGHEIENIGYDDQPWRILGKASITDLIGYCDSTLLYPNYDKSIPFSYLETQIPVKTLQLLEVKSFFCFKNQKGKWRGKITDLQYGMADWELSITDPMTLDRLNRGQLPTPHCLICLSLGQPWPKEPGAELRCYRLIAGVIEVLLESILVEMKRIGWTVEQGKQYIKENFAKTSRYQLSQAEANQFLEFLTGLNTEN